MRARFGVIAFFALATLGCEDDARDLDYLKPHPIPIEAGTPDAGSVVMTIPDAGGTDPILAAPDAGTDASSSDGGSDDAG